MGYKVSFLDNAEYGAADINNRLKKYVTSGIADPFTDGVPYNATKINDITVPISASGVVPESVNTCKCTINTTNKTVTISQGTVFFENGTDIEIDLEGVTLPYTTGQINYVYVKSDLVANVVSPYCSVVEPTGDYVPLAEISTTGVLTDKRKYARGKLPGYQSNANGVMVVNDTVTLTRSGITMSANYDIYIGENNYTTMCCAGVSGGFAFSSFYDIATDSYISVRAISFDGFISTSSLFLEAGGYPVSMVVNSISDGVINTTLSHYDGSALQTEDFNIVNLRIS